MRFAILSILLLFLSSRPLLATEEKVSLLILGVAQDAGYPQAGCYRPHCMPGWQDKKKRITATAIALVDADGKNYLFEASPHMPDQIFRLHQKTGRKIPDGIFLTHAHIGHYTGLMYLGHEAMGAKGTPVYAMPRMKNFLESNGPWSQLVSKQNIALKSLSNESPVRLSPTLSVTPILVPHRDEYSETVGYHIQGPHKSALFIPDINKWSLWKKDIREEIKKVDYAFLDATFYSGKELPGRDMSKIPHPTVTASMALFDPLPASDRSRV